MSLCFGRAQQVLHYSNGSKDGICKWSPFLGELQRFLVYTNCSDPRLLADACPSFPGRTGFHVVYETKYWDGCSSGGLQLDVLNGAPSYRLGMSCSRSAIGNEFLVKHYIGPAEGIPDNVCKNPTSSVTWSSGLDSSKWTYDGPKERYHCVDILNKTDPRINWSHPESKDFTGLSVLIINFGQSPCTPDPTPAPAPMPKASSAMRVYLGLAVLLVSLAYM